MIGILVMAMALSDAAPTEEPLLPEAAALASQATEWLLAGEALPADYRLRLLAMRPEARLQAIVFLRRAGLLTGDGWALSDILGPSVPPASGAREPQ